MSGPCVALPFVEVIMAFQRPAVDARKWQGYHLRKLSLYSVGPKSGDTGSRSK